MARKRKDNALGILAFIIALPVLFANWLYDTLGIPTWLTYTLLISAAVTVLITYFAKQNRRFRAIQIANIDAMPGIDFERYLQKLLSMQGYRVRMTPVSGDLGVDLVASRNGDNIAIQVKRYNTKVSRRAISDAVAGMQHYRGNKAMVITNNYFTPGAVTLARSTGCILADRDTLARWIVEFQNVRNRNT
jgi:restriction system protein